MWKLCIICNYFRISYALKNPEIKKNPENSHAWNLLVFVIRLSFVTAECFPLFTTRSAAVDVSNFIQNIVMNTINQSINQIQFC